MLGRHAERIRSHERQRCARARRVFCLQSKPGAQSICAVGHAWAQGAVPRIEIPKSAARINLAAEVVRSDHMR